MKLSSTDKSSSKNAKNYSIVLTQSEKKISKKDKEKQIKDFDKQDKSNMRMQKGAYFWNLHHDFKPIYDNFNLLSYLSAKCTIRVLARVSVKVDGKQVHADVFTSDLFECNQQNGDPKKYILVQRSRGIGTSDIKKIQTQQTNLSKSKHSTSSTTTPPPNTIEYQIIEPQKINQNDPEQIKSLILSSIDNPQNPKITVNFSLQIQQIKDNKQSYLCHMKSKTQILFEDHRELIVINIKDNNKWIYNKFQQNQDQYYYHRISNIRKPKVGQIQYFYKEPENVRNKVIQGLHMSLALQGGGCKGVQYIGAYKAIKQQKPQPNITSVIGSSAGSILGLAIALGLSCEEITQLCIKKLSKVTDDQKFKTITKEDQIKIKEVFQKLMGFFEKFNIFEPKLLDAIRRCLQNQQVQIALLELILQKTNSEVHKLFKDHSTQSENKLNMLGLMNASLMTGDVIKEIAITCIKLYLEAHQEFKMEDYTNKNYKDNQQWARNMTMRELYSLTGVQFTCTAVDTTNYILRFLNQKTTPDLPVCKAVQMSGSFPVAFQAQKWQKSWGKYYIHYDNIRREVDLTGCQLTDGGTLANFPVKYLDNEDMRPMYFSHVKDNNTIMYGIGLISEESKEVDLAKQKRLKQINKRLMDAVMGEIGVCLPLSSWIFSKFGCGKPQQKIVEFQADNPFKQLKEIPLIGFGLNLLQTYSETKDNLIEQCFSHSSFQTTACSNFMNQIRYRPSDEKTYENIHNLADLIQKQLKPSHQGHSDLQAYENFKKNLLYLTQCHDKSLWNEKYVCEVSQILQTNLQKFYYALMGNQRTDKQKDSQTLKYQNTKRQNYIELLYSTIKHHFPQQNLQPEQKNQIIGLSIQKLQNLRQAKVFMLSELSQDLTFMHNFVLDIINFCNIIIKTKVESQYFMDTMANIRKRERFQAEIARKSLQQYAEEKKAHNYKFFDRSVAYGLSSLQNLTLTTPIKKLKNIEQAIKNSAVPDLFINQQADANSQLIKAYTHNKIQNFYMKSKQQNPKADGLHLVLESVALSQLYFHEYYQCVKDALFEHNKYIKDLKSKNKNKQDQSLQQLKVTTMTATSFHSMIIFLHASDLSEHRIGEEVWNIRDLMRMNKGNLKERYERADWAKVTPLLLREMQKSAIERKKDIFRYIQEDIQLNRGQYTKQFHKVKNIINDKMDDVRISNQELITSIEASLSYVARLLNDLQKQKIQPHKIAEQLEKHLLLCKHKKLDAELMRKQTGERVEGVFKFFFDKYHDIIKYLTLSTPYVIEQVMKILKPDQREQVWKGVILSQFLSVDKIKRYVQGILEEIKLGPNTTLKQFYDSSNKKIQINFSVVQENFVTIFNHKTRPNMPVWAAIVAASSIPQFFPPLLDRPEWRQKTTHDHKTRCVKNYFRKPENPYIFITSSQALTRLPLDLLQNNKFRSKITDLKKQIFLVFNFGEFSFKSIAKQPISKFKITQLSIGECISKFLSIKSKIAQVFQKKSGLQRLKLYNQQKNANALKMITSLPFLQGKAKVLNLYVQSHDNLIVKLYKKQLIQMPIRFGTLDFHLMTNGKGGLSDHCQDAIMQAQYLVKQKIRNRPCQKIQTFDNDEEKKRSFENFLNFYPEQEQPQEEIQDGEPVQEEQQEQQQEQFQEQEEQEQEQQQEEQQQEQQEQQQEEVRPKPKKQKKKQQKQKLKRPPKPQTNTITIAAKKQKKLPKRLLYFRVESQRLQDMTKYKQRKPQQLAQIEKANVNNKSVNNKISAQQQQSETKPVIQKKEQISKNKRFTRKIYLKAKQKPDPQFILQTQTQNKNQQQQQLGQDEYQIQYSEYDQAEQTDQNIKVQKSTSNTKNTKKDTFVYPNYKNEQQVNDDNILKIRFLSMLNPCKSIGERLKIYYREKKKQVEDEHHSSHAPKLNKFEKNEKSKAKKLAKQAKKKKLAQEALGKKIQKSDKCLSQEDSDIKVQKRDKSTSKSKKGGKSASKKQQHKQQKRRELSEIKNKLRQKLPELSPNKKKFVQTQLSNLDESSRNFSKLTHQQFSKLNQKAQKIRQLIKNPKQVIAHKLQNLDVEQIMQKAKKVQQKVQGCLSKFTKCFQKQQQQQPQNDSDDQSSQQQQQQFTKLQSEYLYLPYNEYQKLDKQLQLKIIYPSSDLTEIKTNYYILDLDCFYQQNQRLLKSKVSNRFGFVYCFNFDRLYRKQEKLNVQGDAENDYMNNNTQLALIPDINIKSNIIKTPYHTILCPDCIYLYQVTKSQNSGQSIFKCQQCEKQVQILNTYHIKHNIQKNQIECMIGHQLTEKTNQSKEYQLQQFYNCNMCDNPCIDGCWKDQECGVTVCDRCRIQYSQMCMDDY